MLQDVTLICTCSVFTLYLHAYGIVSNVLGWQVMYCCIQNEFIGNAINQSCFSVTYMVEYMSVVILNKFKQQHNNISKFD